MDETTEPCEEALKTAYAEVCDSFHRIEDFRAKLLGFLPLVSGTGIFLLFSNTFINNAAILSSKYLTVIGTFGFVVTLGLLFYEFRGIQRCIRLEAVGKELEGKMKVEGQFKRRSHSAGRFINEPMASGIIYSMVLAAWIYVAVISSWPSVAVLVAGAVFLIGFTSARLFYLAVRGEKGERF
jgi:hypothetical protein